MIRYILACTIYLPYNLKTLYFKLFKRKNIIKNSYKHQTYYFKFIKKNKVDNIVNIKCPYIPERKTEDAAGFDLIANIPENTLIFRAGDVHLVPTGLHIEIPKGKCGLLIMRSGISSKTPLTLANGIGLIDSDYRGEILVPIRNTSMTKRASISKGERIAQLLIVDYFIPTLKQVKFLTDTKRNTNGFGSTGIK